MRWLGLTKQQQQFLLWAMFLALTGMIVKSCRTMVAPRAPGSTQSDRQ